MNAGEMLILPRLQLIWQFPRNARPNILRDLERWQAGKRIVHVRSHEALQAILTEVRSDAHDVGTFGPPVLSARKAMIRPAFAAVIALASCSGPAVRTNICPTAETAIVLLSDEHELHLCENGALVRTFAVALGRGGTGKTKEGDRKTPLGGYPLGMPRASAGYGTFIPIGYPTASQARAGYTGGAVGIHGPKRSSRILGRLNNWIDWTLGCIAVSSDEEIESIAAWVRNKRPSAIRIE